MKNIIFNTNSFYKILVAAPIVIGIVLLIFGLQDFSEATDEQKKSTFLTLMMFLIFFFGVSFMAMRDLKKIKRDNGIWTVKYLYFSRSNFIFSRENTKEVLIIEDFSMSPGIWHNKVKVELKNGSNLFIKSYETRDFNKMLKLIEKDFNELIKKKF